jgi:hypothetical protein
MKFIFILNKDFSWIPSMGKLNWIVWSSKVVQDSDGNTGNKKIPHRINDEGILTNHP